MYTIKILSPLLLSMCAEGFATGQGDYCVVDQSQPNMIKYYEPGKSCYINGTFYRKCEDRNGTI